MRLIVVDGLDGSGKDTHAQNIRRILEEAGEEVTVVSHPSERLLGRLSKRSLQGSGPVARLFATIFYTIDVLISVRWFRRQRTGTAVFVRYLLGAAYLPARLAPSGYKFFRKLLPTPDLALFIDIEPEIALRRIAARGQRREMFETKTGLDSIRRVAKALVASDWVIIDNSVDGEKPFKEVELVLKERLLSREAL